MGDSPAVTEIWRIAAQRTAAFDAAAVAYDTWHSLAISDEPYTDPPDADG